VDVVEFELKTPSEGPRAPKNQLGAMLTGGKASKDHTSDPAPKWLLDRFFCALSRIRRVQFV
jgi:hypothetical protein